MSDLISRKALLNHLSSWQMEQFAEVGHEKEYNLLDMIIRGVENQPTVEPPKGEWKQRTDFDADNNAIFECSNCLHGDVQGRGFEVPFCWYCGADMRKKVF